MQFTYFALRMFLSSVKRLRIMRTSEANGLGMLMCKNKLKNLPPKAGMSMILTLLLPFAAPRLQERNARQRCTG